MLQQQPRIFTTRELRIPGTLEQLKPDTTENKAEPRVFDSKDLLSPQSAQTQQDTSIPVNPPETEDGSTTVGDAWQRGIANMYGGAADFYYQLDAWQKDLANVIGLPEGHLFKSIEDYLRGRSQELEKTAEPSTIKPAEKFTDYLNLKRAYQTFAEGAPLTLGVAATLIANPTAGTLLMTGMESGDIRKDMDEYEVQGNKINPVLKQTLPVVAGAIISAMEKTGLKYIGKSLKIPNFEGKIANIFLKHIKKAGLKKAAARGLQAVGGTLTESVTEGGQEVVKMLAESGYRGKIDPNFGKRFMESAYQGLVVGAGLTAAGSVVGEVGESPTDVSQEGIENKVAYRQQQKSTGAEIRDETFGDVDTPEEKARTFWDKNLEYNPLRGNSTSAAGAHLAYILEAGGDILREVGKKDFSDMFYIEEKLNRIKNSLQQRDWSDNISSEDMDKISKMVDINSIPQGESLIVGHIKRLLNDIVKRKPENIASYINDLHRKLEIYTREKLENTKVEVKNINDFDINKVNVNDIQYEPPKELGIIAQNVMTPLFALKGKPLPFKDAFRLVTGELEVKNKVADYKAWYQTLMHKLSKTELDLTTELMDLEYRVRSTSESQASIINAKSEQANIYKEHPRLRRIIEGIDQRGGLIELFEEVKQRMRASLKERLIKSLQPEETNLVNTMLETELSKEEIGTMLDEVYNFENDARVVYDKTHGIGSWAKAKPKTQAKQIKDLKTAKIKILKEKTNEIKDTSKWGLRDYITHIEIGNYRVIDSRSGEPHVVALGQTAKEAKRRAFEFRQKEIKQGREARKEDFKVELSVAKINPTKKSKHVLEGYKNLFEVLPAYVYAMEKRIIMQPIIDQYNRNRKANPNQYTPDVETIINNQLDYVMGNKYSLGDKIMDKIFTHKLLGWRPGKYSRGLSVARKVTANVKLGYRPAAAFINLAGGYGNTWTVVGTQIFNKASQAIKEGKYTDPEGNVIDIKEKLNQIEKKETLGVSFDVEQDGTVKTRTSLLAPLGGFQYPETKIRPHSFVANYILQRETLGKSDALATPAALENMFFQQFTYNLAALPNIMRSPGQKTILQFKSYFVNQLQFISMLKGKQLLRMMGVQLALAGPRGLVFMAKSIPLLGALGLMGFLDKSEEWLVRQKGMMQDIATRGIGGLLGADISAPATFQFPNKPEDWIGPFLKDTYDLYKKVLLPLGTKLSAKAVGKSADKQPNYITDDAINWFSSLSPLMSYWKDLESTLFVWDEIRAGEFAKAKENLSKNLQMPRIWVRDSAGNKAYMLNSIQDKMLLLMGAAPTSKSQMQVLKKLWRQDSEISKDNRKKWYGKVSKRLMKGLDIDTDLWNDAIIYMIDPDQIPKAIEFKEMTPQQRETMKSRLYERGDAFLHFGIE